MYVNVWLAAKHAPPPVYLYSNNTQIMHQKQKIMNIYRISKVRYLSCGYVEEDLCCLHLKVLYMGLIFRVAMHTEKISMFAF